MQVRFVRAAFSAVVLPLQCNVGTRGRLHCGPKNIDIAGAEQYRVLLVVPSRGIVPGMHSTNLFIWSGARHWHNSDPGEPHTGHCTMAAQPRLQLNIANGFPDHLLDAMPLVVDQSTMTLLHRPDTRYERAPVRSLKISKWSRFHAVLVMTWEQARGTLVKRGTNHPRRLSMLRGMYIPPAICSDIYHPAHVSTLKFDINSFEI